MSGLVTFQLIICGVLITFCSSQECSYYQEVNVNREYEIFSPGYDQLYGQNKKCSWVAVAPDEHNLQLDCVSVQIPRSNNCIGDRIELSESGRLDLQDARRICGFGHFTFLTPEKTLVMRFISIPRSTGGKFYCKMRAVPNPCECGKKSRTRIVGGVETRTHEFPMMAGIVALSAPNNVFCGATIISERYCLSAGHCVEKKQPRNLGILVGEDNTAIMSETPYTRVYNIAQITVHPEYKRNGMENDIVIVKTVKAMEFNLGVNIACLPFKYKDLDFNKEKVTAVGWGTLEFAGEKPDKLMKVNLDVISNSECKSRGMNATDRHLCTYTKGKDSCQFDSGGPLLYEGGSEARLYHVGIISYGSGCATSKPSVNVRVTKYLDWILENTKDAKFCNK